MNNLHLLFYLLLISVIGTAQKPAEKPKLNPTGASNWSFDGFSYADLGTREEHSYFSVMHQLNPKLYAELQVFYDTYAISNRLRAELQLKRYLAEKVYIFSGIQLEAETGVLPGNSMLPPRLGAIAGFGYDIKDNLLLELKSNFQLNKSPMGVFGERQIRMPQVHTIYGRYKF